ncbi:hypothetical protein [Mesorhizobium sp. M0012]|uniref:hypothetical protein n=1 Tax=Mesorhizobium sp. M0012 TaxID=2956840 RepID=UPI003336172D
MPIIAIRFVFDGCTAQDPAGKERLANLMTGLFHEGAGDLDSDAVQVKLDNAAFEMSFGAQRDGINGSMRMLSEQQDAAIDLLRLAVNRPRFDQEAVDRVRSQIFCGSSPMSAPETIAQRKWRRAIYGTHPYWRPDEGTKVSRICLKARGAVFAGLARHLPVQAVDYWGALLLRPASLRVDRVADSWSADCRRRPPASTPRGWRSRCPLFNRSTSRPRGIL